MTDVTLEGSNGISEVSKKLFLKHLKSPLGSGELFENIKLAET